MLSCILAACVGCGPTAPVTIVPAPTPPNPPASPDIVLVVVDTLRADAIGCYGQPRITSPHLDRLSRAGTLLSEARSASPWTLPSLASAFSGLPPHQTGVAGQLDRVADGVPSIAEQLHDRGYRTTVTSANYLYVTPRAGLGRGFDTFDVLWDEDGEARVGPGLGPLGVFGHKVWPAPARRVVAHGLAQWRRDPPPRLLYLHFMDAHWPYRTVYPTKPTVTSPTLANTVLAQRVPSRQDADAATALYLRAVSGADLAIGSLVRELGDAPLRLVITSDHGEELGEHGALGHGHALHDVLLRVPVLLGGGPARIDTGARTLTDLGGYLRDGRWPTRAIVEAELATHGLERAAVAFPSKLVAGTRGDCLFDLSTDPGERFDIGAANAPPALRAALAATGAAPVTNPMAATEQELRDLGYLR